MNNKLLYVIIVLLIIIIGGGAYFMFSGKGTTKTVYNGQPETAAPIPTLSPAVTDLSEQPDQAKFNEYLSDIYLGKMATGKEIGKDGFPTKTNIFASKTDLFCTMMTLKKNISSGNVATAVYDVVAQQDQQPKTVFPMEVKAGGSGGCSTLEQPIGKYEYKFYIDDVLAAVLPFEVK